MDIYRTPPALILVAACGSLSACGGIQDALDFADERSTYEASLSSLQSRSNTAYAAVPDTGASTYRGEASMGVGDTSVGVALVGDAEITVDFENAEVTGRIGGFTGVDREEDFSDFNGSLVFSNGALGSENPNDVDAALTGTLTGGGYVIGVDALWEGHLIGTPIVGVLGDTTTSQSTFTLNGEEVPGGIVVATTN
ncbi:hypothetical protein Q4555_11860 [Octadecabacter sp. 1_MG-2023]|uniref:hypothetical protein n=1 Tax=unclassified Octadecabacter TaxID=196158 RepID=UPI001C08499F|nr:MULTISPECIES: hypothetical protein [unclassified Octadecabacter]MBU2993790.1 hypothetical protein [Octadecabacter sp. B2R22]MDO6735365.1 hypothetical protein [Octadecabacter sp. 1_MG-2023]